MSTTQSRWWVSNNGAYLVVSEGGEVADFSQSDTTSGKALLYRFKFISINAKLVDDPAVELYRPLSSRDEIDNVNFHRGVRYSHMTCDSRDSFPTFPCFEGIYFLRKDSNLPVKRLERVDLRLDNKENEVLKRAIWLFVRRCSYQTFLMEISTSSN